MSFLVPNSTDIGNMKDDVTYTSLFMYENYSFGILNIGLSSSSKMKVKFMSRNEQNSLLSPTFYS